MKLTGIFLSLNVENIPPEDIARWLKPNPGLDFVENYLANKLLYPQTIPYSQSDLAIELAILREVVKRSPEKFMAPNQFIIPPELAERIGTLPDLTLALFDVLAPKEPVAVFLGSKAVGSVIPPSTPGEFLQIEIMGKKYRFKR